MKPSERGTGYVDGVLALLVGSFVVMLTAWPAVAVGAVATYFTWAPLPWWASAGLGLAVAVAGGAALWHWAPMWWLRFS